MSCRCSGVLLVAVGLVFACFQVHAQMSIGVGYEYSGEIYGGVLSSTHNADWHTVYGGLEGSWPHGPLNLALDARMLRLLVAPPTDEAELPGFGIGFQGAAYLGLWLIGRDVVAPGPRQTRDPPCGIAISVNGGLFLGMDVFVMPLPWIGLGFGPASEVQFILRLSQKTGVRLNAGVQYDVGRWASRSDAVNTGILRGGFVQPFAAVGLVRFP